MSMPRFNNLHEFRLRSSKRLQQVKLTYDSDEIVHSLFTNFSAKSPTPLAAPVSLFERMTCVQEKAISLIDNTINKVSDNLLRSIYNHT